MSNKPFIFYNDPGHGWLKASVKDIEAVDLGVHDFTRYSYRSHAGTTVYLEEDCDAPVFVEAYTKKHGEKPLLLERYQERSHIRSLPGIHEDANGRTPYFICVPNKKVTK